MAHVAKKVIAAAGLLLPHKNPGRLEAVANVLPGGHFVESSRKRPSSSHLRLGAAKFHQEKRLHGNDQRLTARSAPTAPRRQAPQRKRTKKRKWTSRSRKSLRKQNRRRRKRIVQPQIEGQVDQTPQLITMLALLNGLEGSSTPPPSSVPLDSQPPHVQATLQATIPLSATIRSNPVCSVPLDGSVSLRGGAPVFAKIQKAGEEPGGKPLATTSMATPEATDTVSAAKPTLDSFPPKWRDLNAIFTELQLENVKISADWEKKVKDAVKELAELKNKETSAIRSLGGVEQNFRSFEDGPYDYEVYCQWGAEQIKCLQAFSKLVCGLRSDHEALRPANENLKAIQRRLTFIQDIIELLELEEVSFFFQMADLCCREVDLRMLL